MSPFAGFDWDAGNREKCEKHGLSIAEIESVFRNDPAVHPDLDHSDAEQRFKAIGRTEAGRYVFVVFAVRVQSDAQMIRPISARYMHRKEIDYYEAEAARAAKR